MVQKSIFQDPTLPSAVKLVYTCLALYADPERIAWPSQPTIAADTGLSLRSVKRAVRVGEDVGLFDVIHTQGSNRYRLRDFKIGGYVLGSGPECQGDTSEGSDRHSGSAPVAHEQDQPSRPEIQTRTSSDAYAASGHRASAPTDGEDHEIRIFLPRTFKRMDDGQAAQYLVSAAIRAMTDAGLTPVPEAAAAIGNTLKNEMPNATRDEWVRSVERWVNKAGTDDKGCGWIATRRAS